VVSLCLLIAETQDDNGSVNQGTKEKGNAVVQQHQQQTAQLNKSES